MKTSADLLQVTSPYWQLLGRDIHYLDFNSSVVQMHQFLQAWALDPLDAFSDNFQPLFDVGFRPNPEVFCSLINVTEDRRDRVKLILKAVWAGCVAVTERQLVDFLPGGKFHGVEDPELRARLQHSKLTNLIGEQAFGDLDFSLFKRRNASLHHLSSINIMKRNKTISTCVF